jgi:integration host factor subunit alpha
MNFTKKDINKTVSEKSLISIEDSSMILEKFLHQIKTMSVSTKVKLSGFGAFEYKQTPERIGRNPKTMDSYIIPPLAKLTFHPSNVIKRKLN